MVTTDAAVREVCAWSRGTERGEVTKWRIRVRERRGRHQLTGRRKIKTKMMRETVGGRRRMLSLLQAAIEDTAVAVVAIETRLALREPRQ